MSNSQSAPGVLNLTVFGSKIVFATLSRLVSAPFRWHNWNGAPDLYRDIFFAGIRALLSNITIAQARYLNKDTSGIYEDFCKKENLKSKTLELKDSNVKAHWIGKDDADVVILWLHGGGYTQSCAAESMQYLQTLVTDINSQSGSKLSISALLVAYTLAPEAQFPTQLKQAAAVLSYLLNEGGRSPSNIMVGGDSAGGGLTLSMLSHLRHPHLDVPSISLSAPLRGALLYSPWVSFATDHESYTKNAFKDVLVPDVLRKWSSMYLGTSFGETDPGVVTGGNNYNEPLLANESWWEGMHEVVGDIWMYGGEDEVFIDSIRAFGEKFREGWKAGGGVEEKVVLKYVENNAHVGPITDFILGGKKKTELRLAQEQWLQERLS